MWQGKHHVCHPIGRAISRFHLKYLHFTNREYFQFYYRFIEEIGYFVVTRAHPARCCEQGESWRTGCHCERAAISTAQSSPIFESGAFFSSECNLDNHMQILTFQKKNTNCSFWICFPPQLQVICLSRCKIIFFILPWKRWNTRIETFE